MAIGYKTASGKTISRVLADYGDKAAQVLGQELYAEANGIMTQSKPLVPVDTGSLRASGYVTEPVVKGTTVSVDLGYGGVASRKNPKTGESTDVYAIYVHENLDAHHRVGIAKFLEIPFDMAKRGMVGRIAASLKKRLKTGGGPVLAPSEGLASSDDEAAGGLGEP